MRVGFRGAIVGAAACAVLWMSAGGAEAKFSSASADPTSDQGKAAIGCMRSIIKETAKYQSALQKIIDKCKKGVVQKGAENVPPTLAGCDPLTGDALSKATAARDKMTSAIAGKCGGKNKICSLADSGDDADVPLADVNWDITTCQPLENSGCESIAINTCADVGSCLACHIDFAMEQVEDGLLADPLTSGLFGAGDDDNKCQQTILKEGGKFVTAKRKTLLKCWDKKVKRKGDAFDDNVQCPDTDDVAGVTKTADAIKKIEQKVAAGICKKCGGVNDGDKDGNCDVNPAGPFPWLGNLTCPGLVVPASNVLHRYDDDANAANGANCGAINPINTLQDYVDCINCILEYKADCLAFAANGDGDAGLGMTYPVECSMPECGNGVIDVGEDCDPPGSATCPGGNGNEICRANCTCGCPKVVTFAADPNNPASSLDTGWTGFAHDAKVIGNGLVTVNLSACNDGVGGPDDRRDPSCGVCNVSGPIENPHANAGDFRSQRCTNATSVFCTDDTPCKKQCVGGANEGASCTVNSNCNSSFCSGPGTCKFFFGSMLPLSAGGTPSCVVNEFDGGIVGTANIESGESKNTVNLISHVWLGLDVAKPCPVCRGDTGVNNGARSGTCSDGPRAGLGCDVNGVDPIPAFNGGVPSGGKVAGTSLDCPFSTSTVADLPIDLSNSTFAEQKTIVAGSPVCTAAGFENFQCICDTCTGGSNKPCNSTADCPSSTVCGGARCLPPASNQGAACTDPSQCMGGPCGPLGQASKPNDCDDQTCSPVGGNEGECSAGPFDGHCSPVENFRGCNANSDCPFAGDTCVFPGRECFLDNGVVTGAVVAQGVPDVPVADDSQPTLASVFCIAPTSSGAINLAAGLPGAGRVTLTGDASGFPF